MAASMQARPEAGRTDGGARRGAIATLIAGAFFAIAPPLSAVAEPAWLLIVLGFIALAYAVPALHRVQGGRDGVWGQWGSRLVVIGAGVVAALGVVFFIGEATGTVTEGDEPGWIGLLWMIGFFTFVAGIILFSIGVIVAEVFPRAAGILLLVAVPLAVVIDMATGAFFDENGGTEWGFYLAVPLFGLGLLWIGYTLWSGQENRRLAAGEAHVSR